MVHFGLVGSVPPLAQALALVNGEASRGGRLPLVASLGSASHTWRLILKPRCSNDYGSSNHADLPKALNEGIFLKSRRRPHCG